MRVPHSQRTGSFRGAAVGQVQPSPSKPHIPAARHFIGMKGCLTAAESKGAQTLIAAAASHQSGVHSLVAQRRSATYRVDASPMCGHGSPTPWAHLPWGRRRECALKRGTFPQNRKSGSTSMLQWNLESRLLLKIFSMGTCQHLHGLRVQTCPTSLVCHNARRCL
jgi:hypothetical protein